MITTFLRRWWLLNRLYHFSKKWDELSWVPESHIVMWVAGTDVHAHLAREDSGLFIKRGSWLHFRIACWLYNIRSHEDLFRKLRNVIAECEDKGWIDRHEQPGSDNEIMLSTSGKEIYSFSYLVGLVLANSVAKKLVLILIILFLVGIVVGDREKAMSYIRGYIGVKNYNNTPVETVAPTLPEVVNNNGVSLQANGNTSSTVIQTVNLNQVGAYSLASATPAEKQLDGLFRSTLSFESSNAENLPSTLCIVVESDAHIEEMRAEGDKGMHRSWRLKDPPYGGILCYERLSSYESVSLYYSSLPSRINTFATSTVLLDVNGRPLY